MSAEKKLVKGWCPSLEKPMQTGDGLLVRVPIKFGRLQANVAQKIAELAQKYGNGHLDLSARGNLQIRGVSEASYPILREELENLGFAHDFALHIITNPLAGIDPTCNADVLEIAKELERFWALNSNAKLPEKFLIVLDGGGIFPLTDIPCDLYFSTSVMPVQAGIQHIIKILSQSPKCNKKPFSEKLVSQQLGFIPRDEQSGALMFSAPFGRVEAEELKKLADVAEKYSKGEIILAPKRIFILPNIAQNDSKNALIAVEKIGFITKNNDSRLKIHACVGAPACSSALGETREYAAKYAAQNQNLEQIVHITGCSKGCAYSGKADILITASKTGYDISK